MRANVSSRQSALAAVVALVAGLRAPLARVPRSTFGFALFSVIVRPFVTDGFESVQ
jgi:hypothetical protein